MSQSSQSILDHIAEMLRFISNTQSFWFTLNSSYIHGYHPANQPINSVWSRKTTKLCHLSSHSPRVISSCQLVFASPVVVLSLPRPLAVLLRASWLSHRLSPSSHCAALSSSCRASWLLHYLLPLSFCATILSTRCASLLSHHLSLSSCCAPRHPLVFLSNRLVVAALSSSRRLIVSSSRRLVVPPLVILSRQLVVAPSSLVILSLHRPLVLSSCWLLVMLPLLAPPSCPLVVVHC